MGTTRDPGLELDGMKQQTYSYLISSPQDNDGGSPTYYARIIVW